MSTENILFKHTIKYIETEMVDKVFPFDSLIEGLFGAYSGRFIDFLITAGYLTKKKKPTAFSIKNKFIFYNDGTEIFGGNSEEPEVVVRGVGLVQVVKHFLYEHRSLGAILQNRSLGIG